MAEFKEGDEVTVWANGKPCSLTTVAKVGKYKMTLANGETWKVSGLRRWGDTLRFSVVYVRRRSDGDALACKRHRAIGIVRSFQDWESLSDLSLFSITDIISNFRKGKDQECPR